MSAQPNDRYKDYIPVAERIGEFYEDWPNGRIHTVILEHDAEAGRVLFRAEVYRELSEESPSATGHASESRDAMPSHMRASYLEVCESSAVGRALMLLGYETKRQQGGQKAQPRPHPVPAQPAAPRNYDKEIMVALDILGKDEEWLNAKARKKYGEKLDDWSDLSPKSKDELLSGLNTMINQRAAEAK